jgi:hypothetical protein
LKYLRRKTELALNSFNTVVQYSKVIFGASDQDPLVFEHDLALLDPYPDPVAMKSTKKNEETWSPNFSEMLLYLKR